MSSFYPPYQFIPVTGTINADRDTHRYDYAEIANGNCTQAPTARHDLWHRDGLSGRMICALHLDTPTLVGAVHEPQHGNRPVGVPQYEWRGKPALPANSLKGMISAVAEALSQSALRVLAEKRWHYRVTADPGEQADRFGTVKAQMQATLAEHFAHIDPDLPPWTKDRDKLTPAELLFGAVQLNEKGENPDAANNLAGRVRPRDAILLGEPKWASEAITLRALNAPNQPCPSMYYHWEGQRGAYLSKQDYRHQEHGGEVRPNGRKFYLHHPPAGPNARPDWQSGHTGDKHDKDRMRCRPMAAGQWFVFPIDFDNLSSAELTLLLRSLEPGHGFRHRLGLGKPLGLGTLALTVEGLFLIDRARRYTPDALVDSGNSYHRVWHPEREPNRQGPPDWEALYPSEWNALQQQTPESPPVDLIDERLIDTETLQQLLAVGSPGRLRPWLPVRTPLLDTQTDPEIKTYEWFVANDRVGHQALPAVDADQQYLPCLYADMQDALHSSQFRDSIITTGPVIPPGPPLPDWLSDRIEELSSHQSVHSEDEVLTSKLLADTVKDLNAKDPTLANEVFDALNEVCRDRDLLFTGKALKVYGRLGFRHYYAPE